MRPRIFSPIVFTLSLCVLAACAKKNVPEVPANPPPVVAKSSRLYAVLPSILTVGEPAELAVVPLTDIGTPNPTWRGPLTAESSSPSFQRPNTFEPDGAGALVLKPVTFFTPGVHRVVVKSGDSLEAVAGPVLVVASQERLRPTAGADALRLFWGDAHGHSDVGDGINTPEEFFRYARDFARLDFTCLSEHDFQQFLQVGLDQDSTGWDRIASLAKSLRRPGFAVLLGWEWSSREWGHRVVLFPRDDARWISYRSAATPAELARAAEGTGAISVLAHPKGSELTPPIRWDGVVPGFDVAVEIYSGHGGMDDDGKFRPTSKADEDAAATQALERELPLAFVAFSDTHLSTPGNPFAPAIRDAPYPGGLTAVWATAATESGVFEALRAKRTYATTGERFLVELRVHERMPGESALAPTAAKVVARGLVAAARALERVELMRGTTVLRRLNARGKAELEFSEEIGPFEERAAIWLRGESKDGDRFWTTPVWISAE